LFSAIVLAPAILYAVYALAVPYLEALRQGIYPLPSPATINFLTLGLLTLAVIAPASSVLQQLYPLQTPDVMLDFLPISRKVRLITLFFTRLVHNLPFIIVLGLLHYWITLASPQSMGPVVGLAFAAILLQLTALQILTFLLATHFNLLELRKIALLFLILLLGVMASTVTQQIIFLPFAGSYQLVFWLIQYWFTINTANDSFPYFSVFISFLTSIIALIISSLLYSRWQISDAEKVEQALATPFSRHLLQQLSQLLTFCFSANLQVHLQRDLALTIRFFSSAVYFSVAIVTILQLALITYSQRVSASDENLRLATEVCCALSSFALAAITPLLVKHQLAFFWLERSSPLDGAILAESKLWYARLFSLPAPILTLLVAASCGQWTNFSAYGQLMGECFLIWWLTSSLVGVLVFELTTRPALSVIFTAIASLAIATLTIRLWWVGVLLYTFSITSLIGRAHERALVFLTGLEHDD
jgi:hypothetical protein